ncbi:MAG: hypothetical protein GOMPHAMPRED_000508 [Gomphillus americanus]|uniref:Uncharacterized protein n=1 Tax=Gomphillus americanus TaxID=1940652 RepID=A0A8H3I557_9LECA|nr:MAG: hypothetical protein GOMPHAMPRED_000508 [Gomphillus americanus]
MSSSTTLPSEPSTPTTPRSFQNFVHGLRLTNRRVGNVPEGGQRHSSGPLPSSLHRGLSGFLPVLPNPFGHVHPALRSSPSQNQDSGLPSPAPTTTAGRFSAMGTNPFLPRSSFFTRRAEAPTVLDYGGNVPIGMASSRFVDEDDEETEMTTMNGLQRRWPSSSRPPRRRRRQRKRPTKKKSSVPILFPAMQSQRVRAKMLHSIIFASIMVLLGISYFTLVKINANINSFQVIFVLIFILLAIALLHSLGSCFLLVRRWNARQRQRGDQESIFAPSDRAIPVILVRDEEIGISGNASDEDETEAKPEKTVTRPPPAYGLWRDSVRADPNLLHWQRVAEQAEAPEVPNVSEHIPRPPSYTPPVQHASRMDNAFF